jgi:hypothetical protein
MAKLDALITSTEDTNESIIRDSRGEFSIEMALAFPLTIMVVLLHLLMRIEWDMDTSISTGCDSLS